jgi:shikimate dehydrogenase
VQPDGRLLGMNNDGAGYIQSLRDADATWRGDAGPALVLGAGGAARAIVVALLDEGVPELRITNRTLERAQELAKDFGDRVTVVPWTQRNAAMAGASLLVNTTTLGMHGQAPLDVALDALPQTAMVSDAIYIPLETPLLTQARLRGHRTVNGLGMLLNQARPAFQSWFGVLPEITPELRAAVQATF